MKKIALVVMLILSFNASAHCECNYKKPKKQTHISALDKFISKKKEEIAEMNNRRLARAAACISHKDEMESMGFLCSESLTSELNNETMLGLKEFRDSRKPQVVFHTNAASQETNQ